MKTIRCHFVDFWPGFNYKCNLKYLLQEYDIVIDKEFPDYLFFSCFGQEHLLYKNCIRIFWSGENAVPDLNICDYAVSLSSIQCGDRTFRTYVNNFYLLDYSPMLTEKNMLQRKFCNFIYSNNFCSDSYREKIFRELSKYKQIDSGGSFLNNMGGRVGDKSQFLREYKFTLSIENSSMEGYVTEKILDPFLSQSLPIYWGSPNVSSDYNPNSFVNLMTYSSMEEAIEEIIRLDKDDDAYLEKITTPFWPYGDSFEEFRANELEKFIAFFRNIFDQPLEKAGRRTLYGWNKILVKERERVYHPTTRELSKSLLRRIFKR